MRTGDERVRGVGLAFVAACISGVAVYLNGIAVDAFDDATVFTTAKNGVAALVLLAVLAAVSPGRPEPNRPPTRVEWAGLAGLAVIGGSVPFVLFFEGLARASSVEAGFIHKTLILWVALLAVPLLRERIGWWHVAAIGLLVGGQAAMTGDLGAIRPGAGEVMILGATLLWAVEFVLAKRLLRTFGSLQLGAARLGVGLLMLFGWLAVTGRGGDVAGLDAGQWSWVALTGVILAGFVATWYAALARAQAIDVTAVLVFGSVVTAGLAGAFQGAVPAAPAAVGLALVAMGTAAVARAALRPALPEAG